MSTPPGTLDTVRRVVRGIVESTPALRADPVLGRKLAERMVRVSMAAADLLAEEQRLTAQIRPRRGATPVAGSLAAGDIHRRTATSSAAGTLRATRDAIDFPGFVTSLVTGVFQAITQSTLQQLQAFGDLLQAVDTSSQSFGDSQIAGDQASNWAAQRFSQLELVRDGDGATLQLKDEAEMPSAAELRASLDATAEEVGTVEEDDLPTTLLPLVRRKMGRDRQSLLATMVLMGMQRVVVDEGRLRASMELQVDARSTAEQTTADQSDLRVTTSASGSFGTGVWGASASMSASVGYVRSDQQYSREDLAVRAGLRSSVDLTFRTEQIPLDRMANRAAQDRLRNRSRVPEAEQPPPAPLLSDEPRRTSASLPAPPPPPAAADPGSAEQRQLRERREMGPANPPPAAADPPAAGSPPAEPPAAGSPPADPPASP